MLIGWPRNTFSSISRRLVLSVEKYALSLADARRLVTSVEKRVLLLVDARRLLPTVEKHALLLVDPDMGVNMLVGSGLRLAALLYAADTWWACPGAMWASPRVM